MENIDKKNPLEDENFKVEDYFNLNEIPYSDLQKMTVDLRMYLPEYSDSSLLNIN